MNTAKENREAFPWVAEAVDIMRAEGVKVKVLDLGKKLSKAEMEAHGVCARYCNQWHKKKSACVYWLDECACWPKQQREWLARVGVEI